jgi:hypothetical protein
MVVLATLTPLASILDDAQDLSSIVFGALAFGALFLFVKGLEHA